MQPYFVAILAIATMPAFISAERPAHASTTARRSSGRPQTGRMEGSNLASHRLLCPGPVLCDDLTRSDVRIAHGKGVRRQAFPSEL